jgi:hypothetical protein
VDDEGAMYIAGGAGPNYNITTGAFDSVAVGTEGFVSKLSPDGTTLVYSTYIGGDGSDYCYGLVVDSDGRAYVTGGTNSYNLQCAPDPPCISFQPWISLSGTYDAFVSVLNHDGNDLDYGTYLGGSDNEYGTDIALDPLGRVCISGYMTCSGTCVADLPLVDQIQDHSGNAEAFAAVLDIRQSGFAGGAFVSWLGNTAYDYANGIAVDNTGCLYLTGYTNSDYFPTETPFQLHKAGNYDAFVTKICLDSVCPGDYDCDGILDPDDNCWMIPNADRLNSDGDSRTSDGEPVASGVYFYVLTAGDHTESRKMLLMK